MEFTIPKNTTQRKFFEETKTNDKMRVGKAMENNAYHIICFCFLLLVIGKIGWCCKMV